MSAFGADAKPVQTPNPRIDRVCARAYRIPPDGTESDGTLSWDATDMVVVRVTAGPVEGLGWTYADVSCVPLINDQLAGVIVGRPGLASCALSAAVGCLGPDPESSAEQNAGALS